MKSGSFQPRLECSEIPALVAQYKEDKDYELIEVPALAAGKRIAGGEYTLKNLLSIIAWKSSRSIGRVQENSEGDVLDALHLAMVAQTDQAAMAALLGLRGVGVPVASAILTALDQNRFTIIDYRALESLGTKKAAVLTVDFYLKYLIYCRELAEKCNVSLRDLDRALWQLSKNREQRSRR